MHTSYLSVECSDPIFPLHPDESCLLFLLRAGKQTCRSIPTSRLPKSRCHFRLQSLNGYEIFYCSTFTLRILYCFSFYFLSSFAFFLSLPPFLFFIPLLPTIRYPLLSLTTALNFIYSICFHPLSPLSNTPITHNTLFDSLIHLQ